MPESVRYGLRINTWKGSVVRHASHFYVQAWKMIGEYQCREGVQRKDVRHVMTAEEASELNRYDSWDGWRRGDKTPRFDNIHEAIYSGLQLIMQEFSDGKEVEVEIGDYVWEEPGQYILSTASREQVQEVVNEEDYL